MLALRAVTRLLLAGTCTLASWLGVLLGRLLLPWSARWRWRWIRSVYRGWGRCMARILRVELQVKGSPPAPPFLLVSNHLSYLDIFLLSALADTTFVAKAEILGWPIFGWICRSVETVFVDRDSRRDVLRVGRRIQEVMGEGRGVVLFAEGTTSCGASILPLKASLLAGAAALALQVHHVTLSYRTPAGEPPVEQVVAWWRDMELFPHLWRLAQLERIYATVSFGEKPIQDDDRKKLAQRLRDAMLARYTSASQCAAEGECTPLAS